MNPLRVLRKEKGLSEWKLAKISQVKQSRISLIENDLLLPTNLERKKLGEALGVEQEFLRERG